MRDELYQQSWASRDKLKPKGTTAACRMQRSRVAVAERKRGREQDEGIWEVGELKKDLRIRDG